ncbi:MAG: hypothetical protein QF662_09375, partial [Phycisphaerae bacterium]|nr:hypothetical protein [Phycisphaerae bacterium]
MRRQTGQILRSVAAVAAAVAVAIGAAGCEPKPLRKIIIPATSSTLLAGPAPARYRLRFTFIRHRMAASKKTDDFWRFLDEGALPAKMRTLWNKNDLRVGLGGQIALERLNDILTSEPDDYTFVQKELGVIRDLEVSLAMPAPPDTVATGGEGEEGEVLQLLYENEEQRRIGRAFVDANRRMIIKCRPDPDDPAYTLVRICPQVAHGKRGV